MKKLTLLMLMLVGITGFAQDSQSKDHKMYTERQAKMTAEQRADRMTQRLTEKLDLNTAQQVKVRALYLKEAKERNDAMNDRREEMGKAKMKERKEIMKERKEKMKDRRNEMREEMKENCTSLIRVDRF